MSGISQVGRSESPALGGQVLADEELDRIIGGKGGDSDSKHEGGGDDGKPRKRKKARSGGKDRSRGRRR